LLGGEFQMAERAEVLVVDDEPIIAAMMANLLEEEGYRVTCLTSGAEAVDCIAAGVASFDALVTDVDLGTGISGYELAELLHASQASIATIFMTGDTAERVRRRAPDAAVVLEKPFRPTQLTEALQQLLRLPIQ
jgi:CheY-like chemotaxis protein